ncbi:hypothetical protein PR202_gb00107 [Eleusine coracana subsp. coracana]|uniref:Uncharacterized protein n=1 Tax=Eleusine coracana subsp. coracana TaxID=191504 RepID=A0AAV5DSS8_ELECO|nr:hypothetical protein PR202_gb00107 [Eleusine coracana subsp. coracana]
MISLGMFGLLWALTKAWQFSPVLEVRRSWPMAEVRGLWCLPEEEPRMPEEGPSSPAEVRRGRLPEEWSWSPEEVRRGRLPEEGPCSSAKV